MRAPYGHPRVVGSDAVRCASGYRCSKSRSIFNRAPLPSRRQAIVLGRGSRPAKPRAVWVGAQPGQGAVSSQRERPSRPAGPVPARAAMCAVQGRSDRVDEDRRFATRSSICRRSPVTEHLQLRGVCSGCDRTTRGTSVGCAQWSTWTARPGAGGDAVGSVPSDAGQIQRLLEQVMGLKFSIGTISMAHGHVAQALAEPGAAVAKRT